MNKLFNNEKHYLTLNNYLKDVYNEKVFKISLNGNFSCPNRDGTINSQGCIFCSKEGSGDFAGARSDSFAKQFNTVKNMIKQKWPNGKYIAYLQANTNTYGPYEELVKKYDEILSLDQDIKILSIATRPDCISDEIINYLGEVNKKTKVWVELGFQTIHKASYDFINRGYENEVFEIAVKKLQAKGITVIVHIINGLPNETKQMMIDTVKYLNNLNIDGIKIHMLHIMKETPLYDYYLTNPFEMLDLERYVDIVTSQLRYLNDSIVIHRITGDSPKDMLVAPEWTLKKFVVMNEIDKKMRKENIYQGDLL